MVFINFFFSVFILVVQCLSFLSSSKVIQQRGCAEVEAVALEAVVEAEAAAASVVAVELVAVAEVAAEEDAVVHVEAVEAAEESQQVERRRRPSSPTSGLLACT